MNIYRKIIYKLDINIYIKNYIYKLYIKYIQQIIYKLYIKIYTKNYI